MDLPLTLLVIAGFLWHAHWWAQHNDLEEHVDLPARLPKARRRLVLFFTGLLGVCWLCDTSVVVVFVVLWLAGIAFAIVAGIVAGDMILPQTGRDFLLLFLFWGIREWAFDGPQTVLEPPPTVSIGEAVRAAGSAGPVDALIGQSAMTVSPLRPSGQIDCGGSVVNARSENGQLLDAGVDVIVTGQRNGVYLVCLTETDHPAHETI